MDQTYGDPFKCVQGQVVLTNTDAAFRCTPKSYKYFKEILEKAGVKNTDKSNWCKFKNVEIIKAFCESKGLQWQMPIVVPKGSFIIWSSSTIHSAINSNIDTPLNPIDFWKGWRGVVYVCYRPRNECHNLPKDRRVEKNLQTNHWSDKVFYKPGFYKIYKPSNFHPNIWECIMDRTKVYKYLGKPTKVDRSLI